MPRIWVIIYSFQVGEDILRHLIYFLARHTLSPFYPYARFHFPRIDRVPPHSFSLLLPLLRSIGHFCYRICV